MLHHVKDLSYDQKAAIESLLGRALSDEESVTIRPAKVLKEAPAADQRAEIARQYLNHLDQMAERVKDIPEDEIDAVIDEALEYVRRKPE